MNLGQFQLVTVFAQDDSIVLTCGAQLKALQQSLGGRILTINAPDGAPPELPRLVLTMQDTLLQVGLNRFSVFTSPPSHISGSFDECSSFASKRAESILSVLAEAQIQHQWSGVVAELEYPSDPAGKTSPLEAVRPIFAHLTNTLLPSEKLSSFRLQVGVERNGFFRNYTVSGYSKAQFQHRGLPDSKVIRELSSDDVVETGVQIALDVNSKPSSPRADLLGDLRGVVAEHRASYASLGRDLNLEDILK